MFLAHFPGERGWWVWDFGLGGLRVDGQFDGFRCGLLGR